MSSLKDVKSRKETVSTIRKITKAMELIATSKVKIAKKNLNKVSQYSNRIEEVFYKMSIKIHDWNSIITIDQNKPRLFIVITSDIGMCGSYNSNIIKLAKSKINKNDFLIIYGAKGIKALSKFFDKEKILYKVENIGDDPRYDIVDKTIDIAYPMLLHGQIHSIHILNTKFINSLTYVAKDKKLFPLSKSKEKKIALSSTVSKNAEFEPNVEIVVKNALPLYFGAIIYSKMASSKLSEMSSRRVAMESASDNALEIIQELEKQYNKIRQSKITQEITEIVAGAQNE